jgi:acyl dehydratase
MGVPGPRTLTYEEISCGDRASFVCAITDEMMDDFTRLSGDYNPIHCDDGFAKQTKMGGKIVHGMFLGALFSRLLGMCLPGRYCLYLSQDLQFRNPVRPGTTVVVEGVVVAKMDAHKLLVIENTIKDARSGLLYVSGKARAQVLDPQRHNAGGEILYGI